MKKEFTIDDWDNIMKENPELKKQYEYLLELYELNSFLAQEIDDKIKEIINRET
jgi:hypothetical protein